MRNAERRNSGNRSRANNFVLKEEKMKHFGDITKISGYEAPIVDCVIGGSPCQDLSVAGKRAGLAGERSGLYMEQIRIVKELREQDVQIRAIEGSNRSIRPRYMVWENVPGAFSSNKGKDFAAVLEEAICIAEPQAPDVPVPPKGWPTAGAIMGDGWSVAWRTHDAQYWGVPQRRKRISLVADFGGKSAPEILFECQSLPRDFEPSGEERERPPTGVERSVDETSKCNRDLGVDTCYCLQGNGIDRADTAGCNGKGWREDQCYTLNTIDRPAVCVPKGFDGYNGAVTGEVSSTLGVNCGMTTGRNGVFANEVCLGNGQEIVGTLMANAATKQWLGNQEAFSGNYHVINKAVKSVRRLTPLECERLQGFPDGWTDIGEWIDSKGKKHDSNDSARYKALGNSIALPFWRFLCKRISAQYARKATMASLFDGIGGFPLVWEEANGKGSAIWASEIEEFPMAVTKYHFKEE